MEHALPLAGTSYVEKPAVMAKYNPFARITREKFLFSGLDSWATILKRLIFALTSL
jgi:hypothetical protein